MSPATFSTAEAVGVAGATWGKKLKEQLPGGRAAAAAREAASGPGGRKPLPAKVCTSITDGLKAIYFQKVRGGGAGEGAASGPGGRKPLPAKVCTYGLKAIYFQKVRGGRAGRGRWHQVLRGRREGQEGGMGATAQASTRQGVNFDHRWAEDVPEDGAEGIPLTSRSHIVSTLCFHTPFMCSLPGPPHRGSVQVRSFLLPVHDGERL